MVIWDNRVIFEIFSAKQHMHTTFAVKYSYLSNILDSDRLAYIFFQASNCYLSV